MKCPGAIKFHKEESTIEEIRNHNHLENYDEAEAKIRKVRFLAVVRRFEKGTFKMGAKH